MSALVRFLAGEGPDAAGRTFDEVLALDDLLIERRHDFIQWLFPLTEPSAAVPGSPVLTPDLVAKLAASPAAQARLEAAAARMLAFYERSDRWLRPADHNHLRITRIIRSLRLLVGDAAADRFRRRILERVAAAGAPVGAAALRFWAEA
ncbi:MAG: hypothetical protein JWP92_1662 [Caulobacter sp.]|nr:hypothetical protein [Caulobacter sp.]